MSDVLWAALCLVVFLRIFWMGCYFQVARRQSFALQTSALYDDPAKVHQGVATVTQRLVETCLVVGALALAAWTALFAVARQAPADELSATTRALLLVGAAVLICAPLVFRKPDRYFSYIGWSIALYTGLTAVGLSLASIANDLLHGGVGVGIGLSIVVVLVARDVKDSISSVEELYRFVRPKVAS
jgi:hypothetical protein